MKLPALVTMAILTAALPQDVPTPDTQLELDPNFDPALGVGLGLPPRMPQGEGENEAEIGSLVPPLDANANTDGGFPSATGAPLPGLNLTGLSTEGVTTVETVVDRFLTYVSAPTVFTWGTGVYSVTAAATVTVTDCPCTITTTRCLGPDCYYKGPTAGAGLDASGQNRNQTQQTGDGTGGSLVEQGAQTGASGSGSGSGRQVVVSGAAGWDLHVVGLAAWAVAAAVGVAAL